MMVQNQSYKTYQESRMMTASVCDLTGQWRPSAIMEAMQEMAGAHSQVLGVGRNALLEQGMVWIITQAEVEMDFYPRFCDTVQIETFPMPVRRWFFPRYFRFRDAAGNEIGRAGTMWVLLDLNSRKMAPPNTVLHLLPDNSDLPAPLGLPSPITEIGGTVQTIIHEAVYTDLDLNGHVNNTRYIDWACNALGTDTLRTSCLKRFSIQFHHEVLPGQVVNTELHRFLDEFTFGGKDGDGKRFFDIGGKLMDRVVR